MNSLIDKIINETDYALKTLTNAHSIRYRKSPADNIAEGDISDSEKKLAVRLMRINHCGEVCAQGLYNGQNLACKNEKMKQKFQQAAKEELDHLYWCTKRLDDFAAKPTVFNPLWYAGSFSLGYLTGKISEKVSLGFVEAVESQVIAHLEDHQQKLTTKDTKTHAILQIMKIEEQRHGEQALQNGGVEFSPVIKKAMTQVAKFMTKTVGWF